MKQISFLLLLLTALLPLLAGAQAVTIQRLNPTNWWVGVRNSNLQLLVYGPGAGTLTYSITYPGVKLAKTSSVEDPNYTFLDLTITTSARPGQVQIVGKEGGQTVTRT